jgi:hypothetical protein
MSVYVLDVTTGDGVVSLNLEDGAGTGCTWPRGGCG